MMKTLDRKKVIAIVFVFLFLFDFFFLNEVIRWFLRSLLVESTAAKTVMFFVAYSLMVLSVSILLLTKYVSDFAFALALACIIAGKVYFSVNGEPFGVLDLETAVKEFGLFGEAIKSYWKVSVPALLPAIIFAGGYYFLRKKLFVIGKVNWKFIPLALAGILAGGYLTYRSAGSHVRAFPRYLQPTFVIGYYAFTAPYNGPRDQPYFKASHHGLARHIIFIMDESVRGDLLGVNGYNINTTPFLTQNRNQIFNYGVASSFSNSSASSNYSVMTGIRMSTLPDIAQVSRKAPLLLDYAVQTSRQVYYLFGQPGFVSQKQKFGFQNVNAKDIVGLHEGAPTHQLDRKIIDEVEQITAGDKPTFTWLNKIGSHFNYDSAYPPDKKVFSPTYSDSSADDQMAMLNSYYNSLLWGVDSFFEELMNRLKDRDVIVVYTSDHGQSILEAGIPGTHNRTFNISANQANVPLFCVGLNGKTRENLQRLYVKANLNNLAAEQIFPSLLILMGYDKKIIQAYYPPSMFEVVRHQARKFLSGDLWGLGPAAVNIFTYEN
jgi:glucan phosphoethanolaminetransferase (alkaline phosphatase superfamily)